MDPECAELATRATRPACRHGRPLFWARRSGRRGVGQFPIIRQHRGLLMRVFVTGATGFIGSLVVKDLIAAGHQVIAVYRSEERVPALAAAGAEVYRGSIDDPDS